MCAGVRWRMPFAVILALHQRRGRWHRTGPEKIEHGTQRDLSEKKRRRGSALDNALGTDAAAGRNGRDGSLALPGLIEGMLEDLMREVMSIRPEMRLMKIFDHTGNLNGHGKDI